MSEQQISKLNFLSKTSRRFYSKKKPSQELFANEPKISKVMKTLNASYTLRKINKYEFLKTQCNQRKYSEEIVFNQIQFIKKQLKAKIQILSRKSDKKWKNLLDSYQDMKTCSNKQALNIQQNKFYSLISQLLRKESQKQKLNCQIYKKQTKLPSHQKQQRSLKVSLQNLRLVKQNQVLRRKCIQSLNANLIGEQGKLLSSFQEFGGSLNVNQELQKGQGQGGLNSKLEQQIKQLSSKVFSLQIQNSTLRQELAINEHSARMARDEKQQLTRRVQQLKTQHQNLCSQFVRVNLQTQCSNIRTQRWRSTLAFQREQIISYESQLNLIKTEYKQQTRKYKLILKRLNNVASNNMPSSGIGLQRQSSEQFNLKYQENFREQLEIFSRIRAVFFNKESQSNLDKLVGMLSNQKKPSSGPSAETTYKNYLNQKQAVLNVNGVRRLPRQHYAYVKPNFFNFVQDYMNTHGIDSSNMQQYGGGFDLTCQFLTTIRAILDSKFNQFLTQDFNRISSMANFTYVWLSMFKIHRKQKKVVEIQGDLDRDLIPTFYINLMNEKLNCNWQVITFRQFLHDSLTLDQLYFYLMARHYVLRGDLIQNISGVYQQTFLISIVDVLNLLQKFISDINYRKKIEEYIKKFIVYVRKRAMIDMHFILRVLLEFYQSKKHRQFANLNSLTGLLSRQKSAAFSFQSFLKIFQYNFTRLSLSEKLEIYRKAFSSSRGNISLEVILTVLTQEGYLCGQVKGLFCNDPVTCLRRQQEGGIVTEPFLPELSGFQQFFQKFYKQTYDVQKDHLGLQNLHKKFLLVKELSQTNIFQRVQLSFKFCITFLKKMFYSKKINMQSFVPILNQIVIMLNKVTKLTCQKKYIMGLMTQFKRDSAAKKILKFYRKKRSQMHRNFAFGLNEQVLEGEYKIEVIRQEFNNIISNLKDKHQPGQ